MTPAKPAKPRLPWMLVLLLGAVVLASIDNLRDATTSLSSLRRASGTVVESGVLRRSGHPSTYTLRLGLQGQPGLFGVNLRDAAATARALQQRVPVGSVATVYYQPPWLFPNHAVSDVWQLESQGQVLYALRERQGQAWKKLGISVIVLGIGGSLLWWLWAAQRRAA